MSYLATILADNPIHWWRCADPGGAIVHDIAGTPYHLQGQPSLGAMGYSGIALGGGSARPPDGPTFFIHNAGNLPSIVTPMSVECWIWPMGGYGTNTDGILVDMGNFGLYLGSGGVGFRRPYIYVQDGASSRTAKALADLSLQTWHHIAGTYDQTTARLYVDGVAGPTVGATAHDTATVINLCTNNVASRQSDVYMTEVAVYSGTLSAARIAAHYAAQEVSQAPVFQLLGVNSLVTGTIAPLSDDLSTVLAAVKHTFPTT